MWGPERIPRRQVPDFAFKGSPGKRRLDIKKHFFAERVDKHWKRLTGELGKVSNLSVCQKYLDNDLHKVKLSGIWSR